MRLAVGPAEEVVLVDAHSGQAPSLGREGVVLASEPLLLLAKLLERGLPLGMGDDLRELHFRLLRWDQLRGLEVVRICRRS